MSMTPGRVAVPLSCALALVAVSTAARAQDGRLESGTADRLLAWPLKADGVAADRAETVSHALRAQLEVVLGGRLVTLAEVEALKQDPDAAGSVACVEQLACAADLGGRLGVGRVLAGSVRAGVDLNAVELWLVDVLQQREAGRVYGVLPQDDRAWGSALRELSVRLVAPEQYMGVLVVNGVEPVVELFIDSQREVMDRSTRVARLPLPVGKHAVEARRGGAVVVNEVVDIRFEEIMVVGVPAEAEVVARVAAEKAVAQSTNKGPDKWAGQVVQKEGGLRLPLWLGPSLLALVPPPILLSGLFVLDLLYVGPLVLASPSACEPPLVAGAGGRNPALNPRSNPLNGCGSLWRYGARGEQAMAPIVGLDLGAIAVSFGLVAAVIMTAGALTVIALLPEDEDADASAGNKPGVTRKVRVGGTP
jgi:hypothetical protein